MSDTVDVLPWNRMERVCVCVQATAGPFLSVLLSDAVSPWMLLLLARWPFHICSCIPNPNEQNDWRANDKSARLQSLALAPSV